MSDIVERLRAKCHEDITWDDGDGNAEMSEAADEIERLRVEGENLRELARCVVAVRELTDLLDGEHPLVVNLVAQSRKCWPC